MTAPQSAAFWVWYNTGLKKTGKRSFKAAAKILGRNPDTLRRWADENGWQKLAEEKDQEIGDQIEEKVTKGIVADAEAVLGRQRKLIDKIYAKIEDAIDAWVITPTLAIELMKYERTLDENVGQGPGAGFNLAVLLNNASPEVVSELHKLNGRLRREGHPDLHGAGVGHAGTDRAPA